MKFKLINDRAARVQVKGSILDRIVRFKTRHNGGTPTVSSNGCWILKGAGGWVTIAAFGSDEEQAQKDLTRDLSALERAVQAEADADVHPDLKD